MTATEKQIEAVGYIRVSTAGQAEEGVSLENQAARIEAYCQYKGFELVNIIEDAGISGGKNRARPGFVELLDTIEQGRADVVILYSLERLSRDMLTLLAMERLLDEYDIELHTIEGQVDTSTPDGFMNFAMKAFLGEMERRQVKHRTKKAMEHLKKKNQVVGSVPYGYSREVDSLIESPAEQGVIAFVNQLYREGRKVAEIVRALNASGHTTRDGKPFQWVQVKRIVTEYRNVYSIKQTPMGRDIRHFITRIA